MMKNYENTLHVQRPQHGVKRIITRGLIMLVVVVGVLYSLSWIEMSYEQAHVEHIANRIEQFQEQHDHLPNPEDIQIMEALGFELRVGWYPDFVPLNDTEYELCLYSGFDGPYRVYNSHTKIWQERY